MRRGRSRARARRDRKSTRLNSSHLVISYAVFCLKKKKALRDYFRDIGPMVLAAEGRKANDSHANCYPYVLLSEYGTVYGRLYMYVVHLMQTQRRGRVD